ncbi:MAG: FdhF/YdeP family oxidoreductase [Saprospiraceae bacterium]|nr:FdhF/YdeP family oxidoreductase [Saprospiraceae bacterium]
MKEETPSDQPMPEHLLDIELSEAKKVAAGIPAVVQSVKHIIDEMPIRRGLKALNSLNQFQGVDCPGCAWPDPDDHRNSVAEYCENGAKAIAEEATTKKVSPEFFNSHSVAELLSWTDYELGKAGRITHPMYLREGGSHYEEISWDNAFTIIAKHLKSLENPNEAVFYTSGRTSNEAAFLYQLFVRSYGTNNLPDCSNMCHESSGVALTETIGIGKGTVKLEDFYNTDLIIIAGQNPGTNHPRMLSALKKAKINGSKIIAVNPLKEAGLLNFSDPQSVKGWLGQSTHLSDQYLQVKINADLFLFKALIAFLLKWEEEKGNILNHNFIQNHTHGFEEMKQNVKSYSIEDLVAETGLTYEEVEAAAYKIAQSEKIILCWAMGWTQHVNAVEVIQEGVNLLLLKGSIGKPGAGLCPVRGHSNVQGDRTMGIFEKPTTAFLDRLDMTFNKKFPRNHGYDVVEAIQAIHTGKAKVFVAMGGNFISATPDTYYTSQALTNTNLTVQVSTKLNRSHVIHGKEALILPSLGRTDIDIKNEAKQFVSVEDSMGVVHQSNGNLKSLSDFMLSEPEIIVRMAKATLDNSGIDWDKYLIHYDNIRDDIERAIPGFENYNERVRKNGGFYLPNGARINEYYTHNRKANFTVTIPKKTEIEEGELLMMTIRSHDQFNTTIYGLNDRYRGVQNERRVIFMNPTDVRDLKLAELECVNLVSNYDGQRRIVHNFLVIPYDIPQGCTATYFPEANPLVPIHLTAKKSNTPVSKSIKIRVEKIV